MMVIVFGDEVRQINKAHRSAEPWMAGGPFEIRIFNASERNDQGTAGFLKAVDEFGERPRIVIGFMGLPICQVSSRQVWAALTNFLHTTEPQWFEVDEMPDLFCHAPA